MWVVYCLVFAPSCQYLAINPPIRIEFAEINMLQVVTISGNSACSAFMASSGQRNTIPKAGFRSITATKK